MKISTLEDARFILEDAKTQLVLGTGPDPEELIEALELALDKQEDFDAAEEKWAELLTKVEDTAGDTIADLEMTLKGLREGLQSIIASIPSRRSLVRKQLEEVLRTSKE